MLTPVHREAGPSEAEMRLNSFASRPAILRRGPDMQPRQERDTAPRRQAAGDTPTGSRPSVWVLTTDRRGDNAQVLAIAASLGWAYEVKPLSGTDGAGSAGPPDDAAVFLRDHAPPFAPPWPDLILTIGRRSGLVATHIQRISGGHTRLVQVGSGDTRQGLSGFDLLISNPQTPLPRRPNVMQLAFPLIFPDPAALAAASPEWQPRLESLPRPWTAVLVGASTPPLKLSAAVARSMISEITRFVAPDRGSLLVSSSPRTSPPVSAALRVHLPPHSFFHEWTPDGLNPYPAFLDLADRFIVTADSVSMQIEVIRLGKPLAIYPLPHDGKTWRRRARHLFRSLRRSVGEKPSRRKPPDLRERWSDKLTTLGILQHRRNFEHFHRKLVDSGRAVRFGEPFPPPRDPPLDERSAVAERIKRLFE